MTTLTHVSMVGSRIAVILYAVHLHASTALVGVFGALFAAVAIFSSVQVGRWLDHSGRRLPLLIGCGVQALGTALGFVWPSLTGLFVLCIIVGTFNNMFFITQQNLIGEYGGPADRVSNFSLSGLAFSAASFAGPLIAGFAIDSVGYRWTFLLLALVPLIPTAILAFDKLEFPPRRARPQAAEPSAAGAGPAARGSALALLRHSRLSPVFIAAVLSQATWNLFSILMPIYLAGRGLSASQIGVTVSCFYFASMVSRLFLPALARRFTPWQLLFASFAGGSLSFVGFTFTDNIAVIALLSVWLGMVLGFTGPMVLTLLYEASPPGRTGEVVGVRVTLMNICSTAVPLLAGSIGAMVGVAPAFWVLGAALLAGGWSANKQAKLRARANSAAAT